MLQQEFETRVKMSVSVDEYKNIIEPMYMAADVDKDEFCRLWSKMNHKRVEAAKQERKDAAKREKIVDRLYRLIDFIERHFTLNQQVETLANDFIKDSDVELLKARGIELVEQVYNYPCNAWFDRPKRLDTIVWEIRKWLKKNELTKFEIA